MKTSLINRLILFYSTALPGHRGKWRLVELLRRKLATPVEGEAIVRRSGVRWCLDPSDFMQAALYWQPEVDRWELFHLRRLLQPGAVVFDIGSNFGYYSLRLAADSRIHGTIHAFEPNPPTYRLLLHNIELNGFGDRVLAHNVGVSDAVGTARMRERVHHLGGASIAVDGEGAIVELTTLDRFCEERAVTRLDFLKIDVEGFEDRVLQGDRQSIERFKPGILIELNPSTLTLQGVTLDTVVDLLRGYGYRLYEIHHHELRPLTNLPTGDEYINVFGLDAACVDRGEIALSA